MRRTPVNRWLTIHTLEVKGFSLALCKAIMLMSTAVTIAAMINVVTHGTDTDPIQISPVSSYPKNAQSPSRPVHAELGGSSLPDSVTEKNHAVAKTTFLQKL